MAPSRPRTGAAAPLPDSEAPGALAYRIGGFGVAVLSPELPLAPETDPDYLPFLESPGDAPAAVRVELRPGEPALPPGAQHLLDAGESWQAHRRDGRLLISPRFEPPAAGPDWVAAVDADRTRVTVTCGPALASGTGALQRLHSPFHYPLDQILLALALAGDALIVHAAGVEAAAGGVALPGASGAGKTTISRLFAAAGRAVLSDDRVLIVRAAAGWRVYGTPWPGEGRFVVNRGAPLASLAFLARGDANRVRPVGAAELARRLLPLASVPWFDGEASGRCLDLVARLAGEVPARELAFVPGPLAVAALEDALAPPPA